jgi:tripartite-type tricarboxylate transporter receptor subunit TctC
MKTCSLVWAAAGVATAIAANAVWAQAYPSKLVKIIVPTSPGGGNDVMARIVGQRLTERLKQPVIVDNKPGGNGAIGSDSVAKAPADGYTILLGYIATHGINPALSKLPYDAVKDFAPIGQIAEAQMALVVHPSLPVKTVKELIALAKSKASAPLSYASAGNGTAPHIAGEEFKQRTGIELIHIPYKGSAPAVTDTMGGHTQVMFPSLIAVSRHVQSQRLRALAVTGAKRSPLFASLPTIAESGVPGFEVTQWYGFFAPAKTPPEIVERLNKEITAILKEPDTAKKFADQGAEVVTSSPQEFGKFVQNDIEKWRKLIKAAKIQAD